jgi:hypothetical protein
MNNNGVQKKYIEVILNNNMAFWKFICTPGTETECLVRRLFGDGMMHDVSPNDTLFLHNIRYHTLFGPFIAVNSRSNPNNTAWSKQRGGFDYQVDVDWEGPIYRLKFGDIPAQIPVGSHKKSFQSLTPAEGESTIQALEEYGKVVVSSK